MTVNALSSTQSSRLESLKAKHTALSTRVEKIQNRPSSADSYLRQLKKQKLLIKEEIEEIRRASTA